MQIATFKALKGNSNWIDTSNFVVIYIYYAALSDIVKNLDHIFRLARQVGLMSF